MIFAAVAIGAAIDGILAHSQFVGSQRWQKGRRLSDLDIATASAAGIDVVTIARLETDDIDENCAATALGAALIGANVTALPAIHGRVNLAAAAAGLVAIDVSTVDRVNLVAEALTLATLSDGARVAAGEIIATVKIIPYAVPASELASAIAAAVPISVQPFRRFAATLIQTRLPETSAKLLTKTARVTRDRVTALGGIFNENPSCSHDVHALAAILRQANCDMLLVAGATATVDRGDVIPAAIIAAGGQIERLGMPVDPGNLLCLGRIGDCPVIGLPGCARSPKRNGFDLVLERLAAGITVTSASIAAMGAGGLLPEAERPQPRTTAKGVPTQTGAIVLAAGRSSRMPLEHKLLADWRGRPLLAHVVAAINDAGLPPPIVVLGERADDARAALAGQTVRFVLATEYTLGLGHSLRAGLAAAPKDWDAALICLGDMPRVDATSLALLAAAEGDVVVPVKDGKRGNPVRWSRRHFADLMALEGDIGGKALLAALAVPPTEVVIPDDGIFDDIDTPADLAALRLR